MTKKETIAFLDRFAKGRWTELADGTLKVSGYLDCSYNQLTSLPENLKVGGSLHCYNNQLTSLPENLKVSGYLDCSYNQLTSLPENLKVGGSLYCYNNQLTSLPENLKVGGSLDCSYNQLTGTATAKKFDPFEVGDDYIYADGILSELVGTRKKGDLTIYNCVFGVVVSDGTYHAHGTTLRQAIADLHFKQSDRDVDEYRDLNLDTERTVEEVTVIYRAITGACSQGCEMFTASAWNKPKITLRKAMELTADQYGGKQFAAFYGGVK